MLKSEPQLTQLESKVPDSWLWLISLRQMASKTKQLKAFSIAKVFSAGSGNPDRGVAPYRVGDHAYECMKARALLMLD